MPMPPTRKFWRAWPSSLRRAAPAAALLGYGLLAAPPVQAEPPEGRQPESDMTEYRFEDHDVFGQDREPLGEVLLTRRRGARTSLVRAREHFVRELLRSVEAL